MNRALSHAMTDPNFITALIYLLASGLGWFGSQRGAEARVAQVRMQRAAVLLALGLVMHGVAIGWSMLSGPGKGVNVGLTHAVSLIVWLTLLSYVLAGRDASFTRLALLYLVPMAALAVSLVVVSPGRRVVDYGAMEGAFALHLALALSAYALFTVATLHALLLSFMQRQLLAGEIANESTALPPLMRIERLMFQLLGVAFMLLTATLISGVFFSEALFGKPFQVNHKTVFSVMSWFVFGGLLAGHWAAGWRGRLAVRWVLIGFVMLLLSYVGSKFVLEIVLKRV